MNDDDVHIFVFLLVVNMYFRQNRPTTCAPLFVNDQKNCTGGSLVLDTFVIFTMNMQSNVCGDPL